MQLKVKLYLRALLFCAVLFASANALAEPYLAVQQGYKCVQCHVNPTGGGLRNSFGDAFIATQLAASTVDTGDSMWFGKLGDRVSTGADLRAAATLTRIPNQPQPPSSFALEQMRVYLDVAMIPERLSVYLDELVAPGAANNREAYVRYWSSSHNWYLKAGQLYLPFGFRLQDQSAFVQQLSGTNMTTPDNGVEIGWESGSWSAQFALSNGSGGGPETNNGKQYSLQSIYTLNRWRIGAAANVNASELGDRRAFAVFAGLRTGPIAWLAQVDYVTDASLSDALGDNRESFAGLLEANWRVRRGHNLKVTAELLDPDRNVAHANQARWSAVYEYSPIQFLQLRGGMRYYDGIPQNDLQNRREFFLELHGFY